MNWFYNLKTVSKLILGFSMACGLTALVGYLGVSNMQKINDMMTTMYARDLIGLSATKQAWVTLVQVGREARKAVLAETPEQLEKSASDIAAGFETLKKQLAETGKTLVTSEGQANLAVVTDTVPQYQAAIQQIVADLRAGRPDAARQGLRALPAIGDKMELAMQTVAQSKETLASQANQEGDQIYASSRNLMFVAILIALALGLSLGYFIARVIARPLLEAAKALGEVAAGNLTQSLDLHSRDEVGRMANSLNEAVASMRAALEEVRDSSTSLSGSSSQLAAASQQLSEGAQEQASSLEETAASLEQITATVKQNAESATQAKRLADSSRDLAENGGEVVTSTVSAMNEINVASKKIADIIVAIDEIAFQTNILALNAAVEAARAGEQGRGFAVVASEVRTLAQRSATAAKEIKALIQDSVRKVDNGSELVNKSGETLREIITSVKRVTDIVSEIAAASHEQSAGIEQVNQAMGQMDQVTQANAAQTEELSSTAQTMSDRANQLQVMVGRFQLDDHRRGGRTGSTGAAASAHISPAGPARSTPGSSRPVGRSLSNLAKKVESAKVQEEAVAEGAFEEF